MRRKTFVLSAAVLIAAAVPVHPSAAQSASYRTAATSVARPQAGRYVWDAGRKRWVHAAHSNARHSAKDAWWNRHEKGAHHGKTEKAWFRSHKLKPHGKKHHKHHHRGQHSAASVNGLIHGHGHS